MNTTLYYSKYCDICTSLMMKLKNENLLRLFTHIVCVDNFQNKGVRNDLPSYVRCVPTVITRDYHLPLTGDMIIKWLEYKTIPSNNQQPVKQPVKTFDKGDVSTFSMNSNTGPSFMKSENSTYNNAEAVTIVPGDFEKLQRKRARDDEMFLKTNK